MTYQLQHLLANTAKRHSNKTALVYEDKSITYRELEECSNRLAYILIREGVKKGDRVGLYLGKSIRSIISIFAILKTGGIYVPLDPCSPPERVAYIVGNCGIKHLISTREKLIGLIGRIDSTRSEFRQQCVILTDDSPTKDEEVEHTTRIISWKEVEQSREIAQYVEGIETDLAYILYTSGSTGHPKGVMISHRAALTFINWSYNQFRISKDDVVSSHAPLHFDLSIFDIFTTAKAGGAVVLVPERMSTFPVTLSKFILDNRITVWYSVPSALILMLNKGNFEKHKFPQLRLILFAGEVFPVKYLRRLRQAVTHTRLFNLYGPTETNVCTCYEVKDVEPDRTEPFPVGRAIANNAVIALKDNGEKIGIGDIGELYVRGPGLMTGYWGDPENTSQVLFPNKLQPHFAEKVYRTGDLVTIDEHTNYTFVGRKDNMIKSKGHRIELGEIETVLYSHPKMREAAVLAIPDEEVTNRLKVFIVCDDGTSVTAKEVKEFCFDRLPKYMVPEIVEFCASLPKTSTGKVNRRALLKGI